MLRADKPLPGGASGVAGLDLLKNFDIELDLKHAKFNLFSQEHCPGNVVYWSPDYAEVPFDADESGHVSFAMSLDDRKVSVDFDLREGPSVMGSKTLRRLFDLTTAAPGMTEETHVWGTSWTYPFKTLSIEGLSIANPRIAIVTQEGHECRPETRWVNGREVTCYGDAELNLRSPVLKALRLYFAFKEKKLYVTPADAHI